MFGTYLTFLTLSIYSVQEANLLIITCRRSRPKVLTNLPYLVFLSLNNKPSPHLLLSFSSSTCS